MGRKQKMSMRDAMSLVPDDMPDGAFWAMAHEFAGLDYGDGFDEIAEEDFPQPHHRPKDTPCTVPGCKKTLRGKLGLRQHLRDKHGQE